MKLHDLRPNQGSKKNRKRVGRGYGSGMGKTSGRGMNGQNSRAGGGVPLWHQGGDTPYSGACPKNLDSRISTGWSSRKSTWKPVAIPQRFLSDPREPTGS